VPVAARSARHTGVGHHIAARIDAEHTVTPEELEALALYASGYSYEEIGNLKLWSPYTVRNRLRRAVARSGARNVTHLASVAVEQRIIRSGAAGIFEPVQDLRIAGE
jgi:DNA-binding NarL/FixJ family response regulator